MDDGCSLAAQQAPLCELQEMHMMPKQSIGRKVQSTVSDEKKGRAECIDNLFWKTGLPHPREGIYNCACFSGNIDKGYVEIVQIDVKEGKALWIQQEGNSQILVDLP